jgi:putative endonuclease
LLRKLDSVAQLVEHIPFKDGVLGSIPSWITKWKEDTKLIPLFLSRLIMYILYILYSAKLNRYYVGSTNDIQRRLSEHNRPKGKYTDIGFPWQLVYTEEYKSKKEAMQREKLIKNKKSKQFIIDLISTGR